MHAQVLIVALAVSSFACDRNSAPARSTLGAETLELQIDGMRRIGGAL